MKRVSIILMVLGMALVSVGVVSSQEPRDGDGRRPPRNGHPPRDGRRGDGQNDTGGATTVEASFTTSNATTVAFVSNPLLGGENTVDDASIEAFTNHLPNLTAEQIVQFEEGDELFEQAFVAVNGEDTPEDGLGPVFNADSCDSCHVEDGRGRPPAFPGETETGFLVRLARPERNLNGGTQPDPMYGGQFQDLSIEGIAPEGALVITYTEIAGTFADGTPYSLRQPTYTFSNLGYGDFAADLTFSPRVANQMIGLGLLEAISEETLLGFADPNDADGDGISGRPNYVWDAFNHRQAIGRFGWKANQPNLLQQTAGAYNGDMGISTSLFGEQPCGAGQSECLALPQGGAPEVADEQVLLVTFYSSTLSVPVQRNANDPQVQWGEQLFVESRCSSCHIPDLTTGVHPTIPQLSNQPIRPFTDLMLHDMGAGLADGQTDFQATGGEWRTPPLWGIGLFETVNGHTYYLHDGRARNLEEAILWHGGEGQAARDYFASLSAAEREALLAFLKSL